MFIVFEGLDGSGTSTQVSILKKNLESIGEKVFCTKEPTNFPIGKLIREYLQHKHQTTQEALQALFCADRFDHINKCILPEREKGKFVISDRYFFSTLAFGSVNSNNTWLKELSNNFLEPDLVILFKVSPDECMKRIEKRGNEKELFEKKSYLSKVWENYEDLSKKYLYIHIVDGMKSIDEVSKEVFQLVKIQLKMRANNSCSIV